jgi:uncharacterized protein
VRAYLDIETTFEGAISVVGIYRADIGTIQLVGGGVQDITLFDALDGVATIVTFNGSTFDLPVIRKRMLVDLKRDYQHFDLMYACRRKGLRGGLKRVETVFGIGRPTSGMTGWDAPRLWRRYESHGDRAALHRLLEYNREDVINLALMEERLGFSPETPTCMAIRHVFA